MSTTRFSSPQLAVAAPQPDLTRAQQLRTSGVRRRKVSSSEPAPDWRLSAACIEQDLDTFFPISSVGTAAQQQIVEAKRICASCPVQAACLEWALEVGPEFGIFGGHTEDERRALRVASGTSTRWRNGPIVRPHRSEEAVAEALEPR